MKKAHLFSLFVAMILMSGCDDGYVGENAADRVDIDLRSDVIYSDPPYVDDGIIQATRYDEEITIIRCGNNYFTYSVNMYGIWFLDEIEIILPDGYEQAMGTAVKLVADTESSSGSISGKNVCYINEVKQKTLLGFDDEWTYEIPVWGESYPAPRIGWEALCERGFNEYSAIAVVYRYTDGGDVYIIGNMEDKLIVCCNGDEIGRYDQCRILTDPHGYGIKERIVLCDNDIDDRAIWQLAEDKVIHNDAYFLVGDIV